MFSAGQSADARFTRHDATCGEWTVRGDRRPRGVCTTGALVLELRCTASGAVGVFPEQAENWDWIDRQVRRCGGARRC